MRRRRVYRDTAVVGGWVPPSRRILQFQRIWVGAAKPTSSSDELYRESILHCAFGLGGLRECFITVCIFRLAFHRSIERAINLVKPFG